MARAAKPAPATLREWPADKVERRPLAELVPYARNARLHSPAQIAQIKASMVEWGWTMPVLVDEDGILIAGHGRLLAAQELGYLEAPTMVARGWTKAQVAAYRIADNKLALNAEWDPNLLRIEMGDLKDMGFSLDLTGFGKLEAQDLFEVPDEDDPPAPGTGSLLSLTEIVIGPPKTLVTTGERWTLGHHVLWCLCPHEDWSTWRADLVEPSDLFLPYPGIWVPLGEKGKERRFIMVQPSVFIAGHMVDRYAEINGDDTIGRP